jgi:hypothetical protein
MPLVTSIERRLQTCSDFLSYGGKLEMVNSVLSSLPTFYMCTLKLYKGIIKPLDKYRRRCPFGEVEISQSTIHLWQLRLWFASPSTWVV